MKSDFYVIGVDFGTDSVRTVIINAFTGQEVSCSIFSYPRWRDKMFCNEMESQFRQHPLDYIEGLEATIKDCLQKAGNIVRQNIRAISIDTTGSTPVIVNKAGTPLALTHGFENNPNAMFILWKDHTATREAAEINEKARFFKTDYLKYVGGVYSSEWFWAKLLHILRVDVQVREACYSIVEHCDWIPFLLTGGSDVSDMKRGICAAGHKSLWSEEFGGLPPDSFFSFIDPLLAGFTSRLFNKTYTADQPAGTLGKEWSERLGLPTGVIIGVGAFDAHMGAVGGQIEPYYLSKVMGTSTCDMLVVPPDDLPKKVIKGICGQVYGSIIPGMVGFEAGQSAFGDFYAWFSNILIWPLQQLVAPYLINDSNGKDLISEIAGKVIPELTKQASALSIEEDDELCIDWLNGRRTPYANQLLTGALVGLNLGTSAPHLFKSIVEGTCFGAKAIVECFNQQEIPIKGLIGLGGIANKSPYVMQVMANVLNMPIRIHNSEQTCAIGAAMFAATAAGLYEKVEDAMEVMGQGFDRQYIPESNKSSVYLKRYRKYQELGAMMDKEKVKEHLPDYVTK